MKEKKAIVTCIILLGLISILNLYNARYLSDFYQHYYLKQIIWYILCFLFFFIMKKIKANYFFKYSGYLYLINLLLLICVLLIGKSINGSKAWLNLGLFSFQPSELMKFSLNLFLIKILLNKNKKQLKIIKIIILTVIPSILVFIEPDTGAIVFFIIIMFTTITFLNINHKYYLETFFLITIVGILFIYLFINKQDIIVKIFGTSILYRIDRLINFKSNNYQRELSLLSIFGTSYIRKGFKNNLIYIPESTTDFILSYTIGNYGFFIYPIIITIYIVLLINISKLNKYTQDKKTNYLIISFIYLLLIQIIINIGMNIGLLPIIGITLPFLSYGGSSLILCFAYLSIIFNLTNNDN